ncbi:Cupredoxin [Mucidula mucida]|nr:Cupredoxin [Mucidula mucida]
MLQSSYLSLALALVISTWARPSVHYDLTVGNGIVAPDGAARNAVLTPDTLQFPGPLLTATKGDIITVTVNNKLTDTTMRASTSINFSGIKQFGKPEFDGQSFVSQCPIAPNSSFTYVLNTTDTAGTLLYRSGLSTQYSDGLRGPLIIYDPDDHHRDLYDVYDESTIIQLGEWYHGPSPADMESFRETGHIVIYDSGLINGVGRIDQHNLTVIEADGFSVEPTEVESLELYRQRYSVVFTANQPVDNYWMRAFPRGGTQTNNPNLNATFSRAIVDIGRSRSDPVTPMENLTILHDAQLHVYDLDSPDLLQPIVNPGTGGPDAVPDFDLLINFTTSRHHRRAQRFVQLTMPLGDDEGGHPMHLHGAAFDVIQPGNSGGVVNFEDPVRRDIVPIIGDTSIVRFRMPGWHSPLALGLQLTFTDGIRAAVKPREDLCPAYFALPPELQ